MNEKPGKARHHVTDSGSKENGRKTKEEMELLERQIKNAVFNPELGE